MIPEERCWTPDLQLTFQIEEPELDDKQSLIKGTDWCENKEQGGKLAMYTEMELLKAVLQ